MIRTFIVFSLLICNLPILIAQSKKADSLKLVLKTVQHDTSRCHTLDLLCDFAPNEILKYAEELNKLAQSNFGKLSSNAPLKLIYKKYIGFSYTHFGSHYAQEGKIENALEYFNKGLKIAEEQKNKPGISNINNSIGELYKNSGNFTKALEFLELGMKQNEELGEKMGVAAALNSIGGIYKDMGKKEIAFQYLTKSASIIEGLGDLKNAGYMFLNIGYFYQSEGNETKALEYFDKSMPILEKINDKKGIAAALNLSATSFQKRGLIRKAIENYNKSIKIAEQTGDKKAMAVGFNNIASVYIIQSDTAKALEFFFRSLKIMEATSDSIMLANTWPNLGMIHLSRHEYGSALKYFTKGQTISLKMGHKKGIAKGFKNLAMVYEMTGDTLKALDHYYQALKIAEEIGNKEIISNSLIRIALIYLERGKVKEAKVYGTRSLALTRELGFPSEIQLAANVLYKVSKKEGDTKEALKMYELFILMRDSVLNKENKKASLRSAMKYDFDKQAVKDSVRTEEKFLREKIVHAEEIKQQRNLKYAGFFGLALMLVIAGISFRAFKNKQKANVTITQQKELVEMQHKDITDSINYAQRIQRALLTGNKLLDITLKAQGDYFIFFQPKDVVSGDFYWAAKLADGKFALVTADSTGHGVPGAIMSMLNISCLNEAVEAKKHSEPADILNYTRDRIIQQLLNDGSEGGGKDGMDCSVICFDADFKKLTYSAANNPIWIIRNNILLEFLPDKMPVGKHDKQTQTFTQHSVELQKGDTIYTLTDGMADQFGGPNGKKFMRKNLKDLLLSLAHLNVDEQKEKLAETLKLWKGKLEQIDDICIIGVKI